VIHCVSVDEWNRRGKGSVRESDEVLVVVSVDEILDLERAVWSALVAGDAGADAELLADDFLGVYGSGFAGKAEHVGQLVRGPTVAAYDLSEATLVVLSDDLALLSYRARWSPRRGERPGPTETMYVTSIWRRTEGRWRNIFSQDTPAQG
jgi:uncharacterized protein (TIGR02246 family)